MLVALKGLGGHLLDCNNYTKQLKLIIIFGELVLQLLCFFPQLAFLCSYAV